MGVILVYDITEENSFLNIRNWMRNIEQHATPNVIKMLVGNKCDCDDDRVIPTARGQELADEYNIKFFEASAKLDINVYESFVTIAKDIITQHKHPAPTGPAVDLQQTASKDSGKNCACQVL
eukprot:CAMPEP_0202692042 /NCGR_PEP_ID=MMETSP1385-20130828/6540_1 /ASSEMBLY_ACC=CAM_ASM_000861 /TAXON_ID=933848 /ORGANISM="Elphidium margaritaceum" /LENGTH=121 /DNA_ID=CAMNT_0049347515 /DNA_START=291 /DNA_END=656 /DNA_ORIENTATION=-